MNTNGARVKRTFIRVPPPINATPPSTSSPPSAFGSTDNGGAASLFTAEPNLSQIRLNNVLPRPAFTTRGAWLSSENTSPLLHKRKEAALPERKPACCASPCLGILSTMCACTVLAPPLPCLVFIGARCGFRWLWLVREQHGSTLAVWGRRSVSWLDSNRGPFMC